MICFAILRERAFLLMSIMYIASGLARFDLAAWLLMDKFEGEAGAGRKI